jgi:hypothetical protein
VNLQLAVPSHTFSSQQYWQKVTKVWTSIASATSSGRCSFCSGSGHFIQDCNAVGMSIHNGKCKHNQMGQVTLSSKAMAPRSNTGAWLCDRINKYHRQNLGQRAAQFAFESAAAQAERVQPHTTQPIENNSQYASMTQVEAYALAIWQSQVVLKGPVLWTGKRPKIGLDCNWL